MVYSGIVVMLVAGAGRGGGGGGGGRVDNSEETRNVLCISMRSRTLNM